MNLAQFILRFAAIVFWTLLIFTFVASSHVWHRPSRKSINVCAWAGMFDLQWIARFEKETGIHVNISYYESNDELLVKLQTTKKHGYDLIVPSDYAVQILSKKKMLKKLDKERLHFLTHLNPLLMGHYFDPLNEYTVPFEWAVYGLGINKTCYEEPIADATWGLIFKKKLIGSRKIMMTNDPLIAIPIAAFYLYGTLNDLSAERMGAIKKLLKEQHPLVEAYTDFRASYYLASKNACVAVCSSSSILKAMREHQHLDFIIPREGSLLTIESFAIPVTSAKDELVYAFMNYMMRPESVEHSYEEMGFFPSTTNVLDRLSINPQVRAFLGMSKKEFERFHLLRFDYLKKVLSNFELQNLWVQVKA